MVNYFKKKFGYDQWASHQILGVITSSGAMGRSVEVMAHMLAAQQIWLLRCKYLPAPSGPLWPDWEAEEMKDVIDKNHTEWLQYLNTVDDVSQVITYKNLAGVEFNTILQDIIAHVINHGSHHRGQVGALLKEDGVETIPGLDYILYVRTLDHQL